MLQIVFLVSLERDASDRVFMVSLESSPPRGVHGLGSMAFGLAVQKFLNIE